MDVLKGWAGSETFIRNLIVLVISLGVISALVTILIYGGPVKSTQMRDGVLFVERGRDMGWKEMGDALWILPHIITEFVVKYVMLPAVLLIVVLGSLRQRVGSGL